MLAEPEVEPDLEYLWYRFLEMHAARGSTGFGPAAISNHEMLAWSRLNDVPILPWEARILRQMDLTALATWTRKEAAPDG